ncbi:uncharacterized protein [Nicotiana sylvestris]|uniref:uncharacterized protein n=1 Tax=Nicotiana sylvestris TaxID=4096 RepID=UPI00388CE85B
MEDSNNARKENSTERVEVTHGTQVSKESASQLEKKMLKFQEELDQVRNLANLSFSLTTPDVNFPNAQNTTPPQNIPKTQNHPAPYHHCNTGDTSNNTPLLIPEPLNSTNDHSHAHHNTPIYVETMPHSTQPISSAPESDDKDLLIKNLAEELRKLTSRIQGVEGRDPRVHLRTYYDKLVRVGKDEKINIKLFMRSLKGDALSWYISQDLKKWSSWVGMASDFMDRFRFNKENMPDVFCIQNLKKKTYRNVSRAQDPQYYERLMMIESQKFSDIIKLGERIEEGIKSGIVTNLEPLQATNKALQSGGVS